jgi:hypothetical protein
MNKSFEVYIRFFIVVLLWVVSGLVFYSIWEYLMDKCKHLFVTEEFLLISITLGTLNGVVSHGVFEYVGVFEEKINKILLVLFLSLYFLSIICGLYLSLGWFFFMLILFSLIGFNYGYFDFNS